MTGAVVARPGQHAIVRDGARAQPLDVAAVRLDRRRRVLRIRRVPRRAPPRRRDARLKRRRRRCPRAPTSAAYPRARCRRRTRSNELWLKPCRRSGIQRKLDTRIPTTPGAPAHRWAAESRPWRKTVDRQRSQEEGTEEIALDSTSRRTPRCHAFAPPRRVAPSRRAPPARRVRRRYAALFAVVEQRVERARALREVQ